MTIERLKTPSAGKLNALTDLWEASVRATHDFLAPEDIAFFRQMVRQEALRGVELYVIRKPDSKAPGNRNIRRTGEPARVPDIRQDRRIPPTGGLGRERDVRGIRRVRRYRRRYARNALRRAQSARQRSGPAAGGISRPRTRHKAGRCQRAERAGGGILRPAGIPRHGARRDRSVGRPYPILHLSLGETPQRIVPIPNLQTDRVDVDFESEPTGDEGK